VKGAFLPPMIETHERLMYNKIFSDHLVYILRLLLVDVEVDIERTGAYFDNLYV